MGNSMNKINCAMRNYLKSLYEFIPEYMKKFFFQLISVKVWCLSAILIIGTYLLIHKFISGSEFVTMVTTIFTAVLAVREVTKLTITKNADGSSTSETESNENSFIK